MNQLTTEQQAQIAAHRAARIVALRDYGITGMKTFTGMEGPGFNVHLTYKGRKVAFVIDEGCGGCLLIQWADHSAPAVIADRIDELGEVHKDRACSPCEAAFHALALTLPEYPCEYTGGTTRDGAEQLINDMVNRAVTARRLTRLFQTKVMFTRTDGKVYQASVRATDPRRTAYIAKLSADPNVQHVLNTMPREQAVELAVTAGL